jgi:group I intron endonuclease
MSQSAAKIPNAKTGIIYMCESPSGGKYIGQHNKPDLNTRKNAHICDYFDYIKDRCILELNKKFNPDEKFPTNPKGYCTALCNAFVKYGVNNFKWSILEKDIPLDDLNDRENYYIEKYDTLRSGGYNLKMNTSDSIQYNLISEETRQRMVDRFDGDNINKYRRWQEEMKDVPKHVTYFECKNGLRGYRIQDHPKCQSKEFADKTTPVEELKRRMLDFLAQCEKKPFKTVQQRKREETDVPKGISEQKPGRFLVQFAYQGQRHNKFFSQEPREEALKQAINWMNMKKFLLKNAKEIAEVNALRNLILEKLEIILDDMRKTIAQIEELESIVNNVAAQLRDMISTG